MRPTGSSDLEVRFERTQYLRKCRRCRLSDLSIHVAVVAMLFLQGMDIFLGRLRRHAALLSLRCDAARRVHPSPCARRRRTRTRWRHLRANSRTAAHVPSFCPVRRSCLPGRARKQCQAASDGHRRACSQVPPGRDNLSPRFARRRKASCGLWRPAHAAHAGIREKAQCLCRGRS